MGQTYEPKSAEILAFDPNRRANGSELSQHDPQKSDFLALCASIELNSEIALKIWARMHSLNNDEQNAIAEAYYKAADAVVNVGKKVQRRQS